MRVLVIEDEVRLADAVARGLRAEWFDVDVATIGYRLVDEIAAA
jgi:DNA-binding response OmpR family regulator